MLAHICGPSTLRRKQEDQEVKVILTYKASLSPVSAIGDPVPQTTEGCLFFVYSSHQKKGSKRTDVVFLSCLADAWHIGDTHKNIFEYAYDI